jgi:hypothetical protein
MDTPISLSVPAEAGYLHVLRSVTAGVAARLEIGFDDVAEWPFAGSHETLAWRVISGLVDEAHEELRDGRPTIVLTKHTIAAGAR